MHKTAQFSQVPVKYYGDYLDDLKMMFFSDLLIINMKGIPVVRDGNSFVFEAREYGTKIFTYLVDVVCEGQKFGTITFKPRSHNNAHDLVQFRFDNAVFYTISFFDLKQRLKRLMNWLNLEFIGVSRMDLCIDYTDDANLTEKTINAVLLGKLRVSGRKKDFKPFSHTENGVMKITGLQVGNRKNMRFMRIYDKRLEMQEKGTKEYILDSWRANGLRGQIYRYEISMSSKFFRNIKDVTLENIFDKDWLLSLMELAKKNFFDLKFNTGKSEINKEKSIDFMSFQVVRKLVKSSFKFVARITRTIKESLIGQKRIIKGLLRSYVSNGQDCRYLTPIKAYLQQYQLKDWFYQKIGLYMHEFQKTQIIRDFDYRQFREDLMSC